MTDTTKTIDPEGDAGSLPMLGLAIVGAILTVGAYFLLGG